MPICAPLTLVRVHRFHARLAAPPGDGVTVMLETAAVITRIDDDLGFATATGFAACAEWCRHCRVDAAQPMMLAATARQYLLVGLVSGRYCGAAGFPLSAAYELSSPRRHDCLLG